MTHTTSPPHLTLSLLSHLHTVEQADDMMHIRFIKKYALNEKAPKHTHTHGKRQKRMCEQLDTVQTLEVGADPLMQTANEPEQLASSHLTRAADTLQFDK